MNESGGMGMDGRGGKLDIISYNLHVSNIYIYIYIFYSILFYA